MLRCSGTQLVAHLGAAFVLIFFATPPATAGVCGDDVAGKRVACSCGDVVVGDTRLRAGDPVVSGRCATDGLIVRASDRAETITLDLAGHALVGRGVGRGILIERGGADGAVVIGSGDETRGQVVGFDVGVSVPHSRSLRRIERVAAKGNRRHGFQLNISGALMVGLAAEDNGGDGFRLRGRGGRLIGAAAARNSGSGLGLNSADTVVEIVARNNGGHGVVNDGVRNDLRAVVSESNGGDGVVVRGGNNRLEGMSARANAGSDVRLLSRATQ